jgi:hypothetical protein
LTIRPGRTYRPGLNERIEGKVEMPSPATEGRISDGHQAAITKSRIAGALEALAACGSSRELSLAKTKLQEAESWLDAHDRLVAGRAEAAAVDDGA